ncbi:MAG: pentapeptide repeat-containing protein [Caulobacteraceae bacterium]|nr:pentapeptide repeat-containing protein [Caulobacteraceae bacterium]
MKPLALALIVSLAAAPALAQNAAQIGQVQNGASCPRCNLFQADFGNKVLKGRNLAGARIRQADMSLSVLNYSNMSHADLRDVNGYGALFTGVNFTGADMTNATFVGAYLQGADFRGAKLAGVNFSGAEMDKAVGLTQRQLNAACGDEKTTLPARLHLPACE